MNNIKLIIIAITYVLLSSCKASLNNNSKEGSETWYSYTMDGTIMSCTLTEKSIVFKSPHNADSEKSMSVLLIEKQIDTQHVVIRNDTKKQPYALISFQEENGNLIITTLFSGASFKEVEAAFDNQMTPSWITLTERHWYSEAKIAAMQKAPGLDQLKREDLLASLQWRAPLAEKLQQYLEDTNGERSYMIYRFVENYRNQRLVALGYNPYKQVVYNLNKQFEGDQEIINLLNEEIKF